MANHGASVALKGVTKRYGSFVALAPTDLVIEPGEFFSDDRSEALKAAEGARYIRRIAMSMRNKYNRLDGAFLQEIPAPDEPPLEVIADRLLVGSADVVASASQRRSKRCSRHTSVHSWRFPASSRGLFSSRWRPSRRRSCRNSLNASATWRASVLRQS